MRYSRPCRRYAVAVGSNRGARRAQLATAAGLLRVADMPIVDAARILATDPVGGPRGQGMFCNGVWIIASALGPHQVLGVLQRIERRLGRTREVRWGPRTLDLDLLMDDHGTVVASAVLELPHPRLVQRSFVLPSLREVAGDWWHAPTHRAVRDLRLQEPSACPP